MTPTPTPVTTHNPAAQPPTLSRQSHDERPQNHDERPHNHDERPQNSSVGRYFKLAVYGLGFVFLVELICGMYSAALIDLVGWRVGQGGWARGRGG